MLPLPEADDPMFREGWSIAIPYARPRQPPRDEAAEAERGEDPRDEDDR